MRLPLAAPLLLSLLLATAAPAKDKPVPMSHADSLNWQKGQIWTLTVRRIWPTTVPSEIKKLRPWQNQQDFYKQLDGTAQKQGTDLHSLKKIVDGVKASFTKNEDVTPRQLSEAVLAELGQSTQPRLPAGTVESLRRDFSRLVGSVPREAPLKREAASDTPSKPALDTAGQHAKSLSTTDTSDNASKPSRNVGELIAAALLGTLAGGGLLAWLRPRSATPAAVYTSPPPTPTPRQSPFEKAEREASILKLQARVAELEKQLSVAETPGLQTARKTSPTALPEPQTINEPPTNETQILPAATPVAPTPPAPVLLYGPAPSSPTIEHRKLSQVPMPQLPICLTLSGADAPHGAFELSAEADHARLIRDGVKELREFFEYPLPLPERFTTIKTVQPGKLTRQGDTWTVERKSKIKLS